MPTPPSFSFDVFLSHSSKDKAVVRPIAERLRADGLRVWLDEWEIKPGDSIPAKIEEGLEHSRVLVLCMSANAFGSDWAQLESGTFRFRDPLNKDRRFIPLRLDDTPLKAALAQFMYINWQLENRDQEYAKLLESCQPPSAEQTESLARRQAEGQPEARQGDEGSQRRTKLAVLSWRESLEVIGGQFEARAEQSQGLHHLFVEASDDERTRLAGPDWFARLSPPSAGKQVKAQIKEPWQVIAFDSLPDVHPDFRELTPGEPVDGLRDDQMIRDTSGIPRAAAIRMRLREGYLCGDNSQLGAFESLAQAASQVLTDEPELKNHPFAEDLCDLFRRPRGGVRFVFGDVSSRPTEFVARGWTTGVLASPHGVLIDMPISEEFPGVGHWLLLLHRLSWRRHKGCPLIGARYAWHENVTVPYESLSEPGQLDGVPPRLKETFANISGTSFYSILGERERPLDVNLASVFAIRLILSAMSTRTRGR